MVDGRTLADELEAASSPAKKGGAKRSRAASSPGLDAPAKRSRVSRACDQCRSSREKCDGVKPTCSTCGTQHRICRYDEPPKKRGIQPNYIRTLELSLAWLFRSTPDVQLALSNSLPVVNGTAQRLIGGKDAAGAEALHQVWRNSLVCKQIDQMLSGTVIERGNLDPIDPMLTDVNPPMSGQPSVRSPEIHAPVRAVVRSAESLGDLSMATERQNGRSAFMAPPKSTEKLGSLDDDSAHAQYASLAKLRLPPNSWNLLEYYFAFTHSWCPMTEKHGVLRTMYSYPAEGLAVNEASSGDHAELWSILALAAFQISHFNALDRSFKELRDAARSLIPSEHDNTGSSALAGFEKGHIKALLTLALLDVSRKSWLSAWLEVGLAARLVIYKFAQADRDTGDRSDRPVLHLAAFAIENTIARHLGLVPHMRGESIQGFDSLDEDGLEEWAPWTDPTSPIGGIATKTPSKAFSTFNALVHELRIAGEDYSTPGTGGEGQPQTVMALLDNACRKEHRTQPSKLAASIRSPEMPSALQPVIVSSGSFKEPVMDLKEPAQPEPDVFVDPISQIYPQEQLQPGFMSIPTGPGDFTYQQTVAGSSTTGNLPSWSPYNNQAEGSTGGDIFEELAMLDSFEPMGQHPQFMQNLGFGPDLDLAEFFGADYQPSNPLLTYMQPPGNGKPAGSFG